MDDIEMWAKFAVAVFYKKCKSTFNCAIGEAAFASESNFLELNDDEISEILDYCSKKGYFKVNEDKFYSLTLEGQIIIQQILEEVGNIKMIYYKENSSIDLSDRLLLLICEKGNADIGTIRQILHNFNKYEILDKIQDLLNNDLIKDTSEDRLHISIREYEEFYSFFGYKQLSITIKGKREAFKLLQNPEIDSLWKLPVLDDQKRLESINNIVESLHNFHLAADWLGKHRRQDKDPFKITDEYDVQDLLFSFLLINYPQADKEDPNKKIAGVSGRTDINISNLKLIIETKHFKKSDTWSSMLKDIHHKIQTYSRKEDYDTLIIFIYNSDRELKIPHKIENDLTTRQKINGKEFNVIAVIDPK